MKYQDLPGWKITVFHEIGITEFLGSYKERLKFAMDENEGGTVEHLVVEQYNSIPPED